MSSTINIAGIEEESIVDGVGIRFVIFTQGCPHQCSGCHNPHTHSFTGGRSLPIGDILAHIAENPLLQGVTFSGGEPFCQAAPLSQLAAKLHALGLDVTTYTGYYYEQLLANHDPSVQALLTQTDVLIDGPYLAQERSLLLKFRGSLNQRIIDLNATRATGKLILLDEKLI